MGREIRMIMPQAIAVDGNGNIYVTGNSYGNGSSSDYATLKYAPDGKLLWENRYNGPGNRYDYASGHRRGWQREHLCHRDLIRRQLLL